MAAMTLAILPPGRTGLKGRAHGRAGKPVSALDPGSPRREGLVVPSTDRSIGAGSAPERLQRATPGSDWAVLLSLMGTLSHFDVIPPIEMSPGHAARVRDYVDSIQLAHRNLIRSRTFLSLARRRLTFAAVGVSCLTLSPFPLRANQAR